MTQETGKSSCFRFKQEEIKALKYIFQTLVAALATTYIIGLILFSVPAVQDWLGSVVASTLQEKLQTKVRVGNVQPRFFNRIIVDNIQIYDRKDSLMLQISRVAAKVELLPLLDKKIRINNAQLIGAKAQLYREKADEEHNFQFLIDAFKKKDDSPENPIDLRISSLLVRQCHVKYDQYDEPEIPEKFNPKHLYISDLSITARIHRLTQDSALIDLRKLSFKEQSSLEVKRLQFLLEAGRSGASIKNLYLETPGTTLSIPYFQTKYTYLPTKKEELKEWLNHVSSQSKLILHATPADFSAFVPQLKHFQDTLFVSALINSKNDNVTLNSLLLQAGQTDIHLDADVQCNDILSKPVANILLKRLETNKNIQPFVSRNISGTAQETNTLLAKLGEMKAKGKATLSKEEIQTTLNIGTALGEIDVDGSLLKKNLLAASISTKGFYLNKLLKTSDNIQLDKVSLHCTVDGKIKGQDNKPELNIDGIIDDISFQNYIYRNVRMNGKNRGDEYSATLRLENPNAYLRVEMDYASLPTNKALKCAVNLSDFKPFNLNLTKKYEGETFGIKMAADLQGTSLDDIAGSMRFSDIYMLSEEGAPCLPGDVTITSAPEENEKHLILNSDFLEMEAKGQFSWENLPAIFLQIAHRYLPNTIQENASQMPLQDDIDVSLHVQDTTIIRKLTGINLSFPQFAHLHGRMDGSMNTLDLSAQAPEIRYGKEQLKNFECHVQSNPDALETSILLERIMKGKPIELGINSSIGNDQLRSLFHWNNHGTRIQLGEIDVTAQLHKDLQGKQAIRGNINPSNLIVNDTAWIVHPARIEYADGVVKLDSINVTHGNKHISVNGLISKNEGDSLVAELEDINLAYIFDMVNFHAVEFDGEATGRILAHNLMQSPVADGFIHVDNFLFNDSNMGQLDIHLNWGDKPSTLNLDAYITDPAQDELVKVKGDVNLGKTNRFIDLGIDARQCNIAFITKYCNGIFDDMQGRASGWARVFGPLKAVNMEGDMFVHHAKTHVTSINVDYHLEGDSIIMRPDSIWFRNVRIYDNLGTPGIDDHYAILNGQLVHQHLSQMSYDIQADAHNILGYDYREFGDMSFHGTIFASGQMKIEGEPGRLNIDLKGSPTQGSSITYNMESPETITDAGFLTYVNHSDLSDGEQQQNAQEALPTNDMHINFDLDVTPDMRMTLLMDAKTGDHIDVYGNGHIQANYYNKGKFQMYGLYNVEHGVYKLSLQDVIRKDFLFQPGSTISFGGDAFEAGVNLKAAYTVPNVSLDDLSATSLGLSNTRVDCIMNITGKPSHINVDFDFDLPNANEDEKQMVRSMISTDEERNMQVIYLLGIGRFYNVGAQQATGAAQSNTAVSSFLSSTLSSQLNNLLSNAIGTNNWTLGANLRTGETGWEQLDVEGILSGRLLNNRLLINGNFGYRESYYSTNNFIGDFDVQYLLTPSLSLKAYNQTNDRYFIQSSLTTQGIGIQFKRDFNNWKEAFRRTRNKAKAKKSRKDESHTK